MAISTNSIIHYTDTIDKLESILKEGFAIKYCAEKLIMKANMSSNAAHPMVSFCDIPLSQSYKHFNAYGRYGIGLTKEWANNLGINPVLYLDSESSISRTFGELLKERRNVKSNLTQEQKSKILRIKSFAKNYSGHLKRNLIDDKNYRFYDEREWRLVPEKDDINEASFSISLTEYIKDKDTYNNEISSCRFTFEPNEISYLIVDKTQEIPRLINLLRTSYSTKCTAQELDILFSKICSTEQIMNDY
jgi:hypothetical protein